MLRAAVLGAVVLVLGVLVHSHTPGFDAASVRGLHRALVHRRALVDGLRVVTSLGALPFLAVALAVVAVVRPGLRREAVLAAGALAAGALLGHGVKALFDRPRPPAGLRLSGASGASYPSGHSIQAAAVYGWVAWRAWGRGAGRGRGRALVVAGSVALVALVAFSRVALGVHYPTDVVGGVLLGAAVVSALDAVARPRTATPTRPPPR